MKLTWHVFLTILEPLISRNARIAPSSCLQTSSKIHAPNLPNLFFHHHLPTSNISKSAVPVPPDSWSGALRLYGSGEGIGRDGTDVRSRGESCAHNFGKMLGRLWLCAGTTLKRLNKQPVQCFEAQLVGPSFPVGAPPLAAVQTVANVAYECCVANKLASPS